MPAPSTTMRHSAGSPGRSSGEEWSERSTLGANPRSTPSWLLPSPVRNFRDHLREIRRVTSETQQQVSRIEAQIGELAERARARQAGQVRNPGEPPEAGDLSLPEWEYMPGGWNGPRGDDGSGRGWNEDQVARAYRERWPEFLQTVDGPGPLGVSHEVPLGFPIEREDPLAQNIVLAWAYALARAADGVGRLTVLDWGGALGHHHVLARNLFPDLGLDYHCRELPAVCAEGSRVQPEVTFHDDDVCLSRSFDLVLASNSLQYEQDWRGRLRALAAASAPWLLVTRVPLARIEPSFVVLQRAYQYGYGTEYVGWVLNRHELHEAAQACGLTLVREFSLLSPRHIEGAPEAVADAGFLFKRTPERP